MTITRYGLEGDLCIPPAAKAIVLFAHGSGSSRHSSRNQYVAQTLNNAGYGTLLIDLLRRNEKEIDSETRHLRFDVELLSSRFECITNWITQDSRTRNLAIGYFGSSTGAAAALIAACKFKDIVKAIVLRGGRTDLAEDRLQDVNIPTLLIAGGLDSVVVGINKRTTRKLKDSNDAELAVIPGAGHLFEESGKMEAVTSAALDWFGCHLLKNGSKFHNNYTEKGGGSLSAFRRSQILQIRFKDRVSAGEMLATLLRKYRNHAPLIIGIPRGGVVVASVVARKLLADFDVVLPRRIRSPIDSENAIGAVIQDGSIYLDNNLAKSLRVSDEYLQAEISWQVNEIDRRLAIYRPTSKAYTIRKNTVILIDDGAATGATIVVAARWIRKQQPEKLVIAVPVASPQAKNVMRKESDHLVLIRSPSGFKTVEQFYEDFTPVTDEKVIEILKDVDRVPRS